LTTSIHLLSGALDDQRRGELVFRGDLLVFKTVEPLLEFAGVVDGLLGKLPDPPVEAAIDELKAQVRRDERVKPLVQAALEHCGVDPRRTYWDSISVRVVPPVEADAGRQIGRLGFHRDTWGSNVLQQTNWWTTIRPLAAERTLAFYPGYWSRPIENSSADWDLGAIRERRRNGERTEDLPIVPEPTEPVDTSSELRIVVEPGDLLCFSGAHLHASVPNVSERTRVSVELRTVNLDDITQGRGAPDLDGRARQTPLHWFRSMQDGSPLRREGA
jgi:Phytanoyl-CoA dioxygenase (PhyH)